MLQAKHQHKGGVIIPGMSIELDWQVVDQDTDSPEDQPPPSSTKPPPRRWRTRHTWLILVGLVLLTAAALAAYSAWTYRTRLNQVSGQVRLVSQLEARAVTTNDLASFVALQDPDDWAWRAMQEKRFARLSRDRIISPRRQTVLTGVLCPGCAQTGLGSQETKL